MTEHRGRDLFTLLREEFEKEVRENGVEVDGGSGVVLESADAFCTFARRYLAGNPAVATYVAERGLGLRLQDRQAVPLVYEEPPPMRRDAVAVTMPHQAPGIGGIVREPEHPISKGE